MIRRPSTRTLIVATALCGLIVLWYLIALGQRATEAGSAGVLPEAEPGRLSHRLSEVPVGHYASESRVELGRHFNVAEKEWTAVKAGARIDIHGRILGASAQDLPAKLRIKWERVDRILGQDNTERASDLVCLVAKSGEFQLGVDPRHWSLFRPYRLLVGEKSSGYLFKGAVPLDHYMDIRVSPRRELRGRVLYSGRPIGNGRIGFVLNSGEHDRARRVLGFGDVSEEGSFKVRAVVPDDVSLIDVKVHCEQFDYATTVRLEELTSAAGAEIAIDLQELEVLVRDAAGRITTEAQVHAQVIPSKGRPWISKASSSQDGTYRLTVQEGRCEVCIILVDHKAEVSAVVVERSKNPNPLLVDLQRLDRNDVVQGIVVDQYGSPRPGISVMCFPDTEELMIALPAMQNAHTDSAGRFAVPRAMAGRVRLVASDDIHGSLLVTLRGVFIDEEARLVLGFAGVLHLSYKCVASIFRFDDYPAEFMVVDRGRSDQDSTVGFIYSSRKRLELQAGDYRIYLRTGNRDYCGMADVTMQSGKPAEVCVLLAPCVETEGRIVDAEGVGVQDAEVMLVHEAVAPGVARKWFSVTTKVGGRFELTCPDLRGLVLAASKNGRSARFGVGHSEEVVLDTRSPSRDQR